MSLSFGKRDAQRMAATLDPEYDDWAKRIKDIKAALKVAEDPEIREELHAEVDRLTGLREQVESFALSALDEAMQIIEAKAKFTVVGQVKTGPGESSGDRIALGWYATERQATEDALKLTYSTQTHKEHLAWVLKLHHGTPNSYYIARKKEKQATEAHDREWRERELARRVKWFEDHPDEPTPGDWGVIPLETEIAECPFCSGTGAVPIETTGEEGAA